MAAVEDLTRGPVLLGVSITTAFIAFSSSAVRLVVRARPNEDIESDDYVIGVASLVGLVGTIFSIIESSAMSQSSMMALQFDVLGQPWFVLGATLAKISICLFFIRIMGGFKLWRVLLMALVFLLVLFNFTFALTTNLQCRPLERLWNITAEGECWDVNVQLILGYLRGAFSAFSWIFIAFFPILIVRDLEIDRRMRLLFYILSALSVVAGVFGTIQTYEYSQTPMQSGVFTYAQFVSTLFALLEQNTAIIAANVIPTGPLFSQNRPGTNSFFTKRSNTGSTSNGSSRSGRSPWRRGGDDEEGREPTGRFAQLEDSPSTTTLVIEGGRRDSYELTVTPPRRTLTGLSRSDSRRSHRSATTASADSDAWPKGIIKTVEVQVVEEDVFDIGRPDQTMSGPSNEPDGNEWDRAMRNSPSRLGNR